MTIFDVKVTGVTPVPTSEMTPEGIRADLERLTGLKLELFGSHFTGLASYMSDLDLAVIAEERVNLLWPTTDDVAKRLLDVGLVIHNSYLASDDPRHRGLLLVAKGVTTTGKLVDVIVLSPEEHTKRMRTLECIKRLVAKGNTHIAEFAGRLKGDSTGYAALHDLMEEAFLRGY